MTRRSKQWFECDQVGCTKQAPDDGKDQCAPEGWGYFDFLVIGKEAQCRRFLTLCPMHAAEMAKWLSATSP